MDLLLAIGTTCVMVLVVTVVMLMVTVVVLVVTAVVLVPAVLVTTTGRLAAVWARLRPAPRRPPGWSVPRLRPVSPAAGRPAS